MSDNLPLKKQVRKRAPKCKAKGCRRLTTRSHGYCWQHADMARFK